MQGVVVALLLVFSLAQGTTICEKYANALMLSQLNLMTAVVDTIVKGEVGDPLVKLFFDGSVPAGSTNFLNDTQALARLEAGLIAYFGAALGCNDPSFPKYMGQTDMHKLHANMPIDQDTFARFVSVFLVALRSLGVSESDISTIFALLDSFAVQIVDPKTICPKYAGALGITELQLMTTVINTVFKKELADPTILPFFNGMVPPGSIDFLTNTTQFNRLAKNLIGFFGAALGCTRNFPPYTGNPNMMMVHAKMPIDMEIFSNFNNDIIQALGDLGVSSADQLTVRRVLMTFSTSIVNQ